MRAKAAAVAESPSVPRSGTRRTAGKAASARSPSPPRPRADKTPHAEKATEPAVPKPLASIPPSSRRYMVVEHGSTLYDVARVIGEYSTLELAQALLRSELEWGNGAVVIIDQRSGEAILDPTSYPVRVSLRPANGRRAAAGALRGLVDGRDGARRYDATTAQTWGERNRSTS